MQSTPDYSVRTELTFNLIYFLLNRLFLGIFKRGTDDGVINQNPNFSSVLLVRNFERQKRSKQIFSKSTSNSLASSRFCKWRHLQMITEGRHSSVDSSAPTILPPQVRAHHLRLVKFVLCLSYEKNENKQKVARFGPLKNKYHGRQ